MAHADQACVSPLVTVNPNPVAAEIAKDDDHDDDDGDLFTFYGPPGAKRPRRCRKIYPLRSHSEELPPPSSPFLELDEEEAADDADKTIILRSRPDLSEGEGGPPSQPEPTSHRKDESGTDESGTDDEDGEAILGSLSSLRRESFGQRSTLEKNKVSPAALSSPSKTKPVDHDIKERNTLPRLTTPTPSPTPSTAIATSQSSQSDSVAQRLEQKRRREEISALKQAAADAKARTSASQKRSRF